MIWSFHSSCCAKSNFIACLFIWSTLPLTMSEHFVCCLMASISPNPQPSPCPTMTSFYPWATNPKTSRPTTSTKSSPNGSCKSHKKSDFCVFCGQKRVFFDKNADFSCRIQSFLVPLRAKTLIFAAAKVSET